MIKTYLFACLVVSFGITLYAADRETSVKHPNVLFILIDDLGWYDVGYNGSSFYETPNIDRFAAESSRFDFCYAASPMCSPTRVSIQTGKSPARHGVTQWLPGTERSPNVRPRCVVPSTFPSIRNSETTLGEAFQTAGYNTAFFGKWHMGSIKATGGPRKHGYDQQQAVIETNRCEMFFPFRQKNPQLYFDDAKPGDNFTDKLTDEAIKFIAAERDKPFFLYLSHFAMHAPIKSKEDLRAKFEKKRAKLPPLSDEQQKINDTYSSLPYKRRQDEPEYAGELTTLDNNIGRLIRELKERGIYDNTIVLLTGDNGGRSAFFRSPPTSNYPLRAGKTFVFEAGIRTPLLIHWPKHTPIKQPIQTPVISMDFFPTLLEMAGLETLPQQHKDGISLVPLLQGEQLSRETLYWHFPHYQGEGAFPASAIRHKNYKLVHDYHFDHDLLFDLASDPNEQDNIATKQPKLVIELKANLTKRLNAVNARLPVRNEK